MEREGDTDGEGHPLLEAVQSCIAAAAGEFDVARQQVHLTYDIIYVNDVAHMYDTGRKR